MIKELCQKADRRYNKIDHSLRDLLEYHKELLSIIEPLEKERQKLQIRVTIHQTQNRKLREFIKEQGLSVPIGI